ncbi:MAG TPA: hypothetical protein VFJ57_02410 [Solirubrobacterales bacterium]|nr:hypothetical protein [Solirubrobacterales bacterium]
MITPLFESSLLWLAELADSPAEWKRAPEDLLFAVTSTNQGDLLRVLRDSGGAETNGFVRLPKARSRVPFLHLWHGKENGIDKLRLTVAIVGKDEWGTTVGTAWRFESPEGPGEHGFWHCQPVRTMHDGTELRPLKELPTWYFDDTPTLPLRASDSEQLLSCMLVAVYGLVTSKKMQLESFSDQLAGYIDAIAA